jgi:methyl-accepting chemotaxis protein
LNKDEINMNENESTIAPISQTPTHTAALDNIEAVKKRWLALSQQNFQPKDSEVHEVLLRYYQDKSAIDKWTSWWYDLSFLSKSAFYSSVVGVAGFVGVVMGLAVPFVAITGGILLCASAIIIQQEKHRRERGKRFVQDIDVLQQKMNDMMGVFNSVAAEMTVALGEIRSQAQKMLENHTELSEQERKLDHHADAIGSLTNTIGEQSRQMQNAQRRVTSSIDALATQIQSVDTDLSSVAGTVHSLDSALTHFAETAQVMHQSETAIKGISEGLGQFLHNHPVVPTSTPADKAFESAMQLSQRVIMMARANRVLQATGVNHLLMNAR